MSFRCIMWSKICVVLTALTLALGQDACDTSNPPAEINTANAVLESPGLADGSYPPNSDCEWVISSPQGQSVSIYFSLFEVENCPNCVCDYLEVRDGADATSPLIGKYCGSLSGGSVLGGSALYLNFRSDNTVNSQGFKGFVSFSDTACDGGASIVDGTGWITSPEYPSNYPDNSECIWRFRSSDPDKRISLTINDFELEPGCPLNIYDYVSFVDNSDLSLLGYWYDSIAGGSFRYTSYSNDATLTFKSGAVENRRGFNISYTAVLKDPV